MVEKTLVPTKLYLQAGVHIGTKFKSEGMRRFVFKSRPDKLKVMDINTIDERLKIAANFLANFEPQKIVVVGRKIYGKTPILKFCELTKAKNILGRFIPGTFTNPSTKSFIEPQVVLVIDPKIDRQAVEEATKIKVPVIALCTTDSPTKNLDFIIPINNNGRQSIALALMILARELLKNRKEIKSDAEFKAKMEEFEQKTEEKTILSQKIEKKGKKRDIKRKKGQKRRN